MKRIPYVILCLAHSVLAQDPKPTSYPDVVEIPPPTVSIRSMNTGEPLRNGHFGERSEKNTHWQLIDLRIQNQQFVQFRVPDTQKCLTLGTGTAECDDTLITAFVLTPTESGAFILQSTVEGSCLLSTGFREYSLQQCVRPSQLSQPVGLPFLWAIVPPFGKSTLLKVPVK